jgi:hypothetical protein
MVISKKIFLVIVSLVIFLFFVEAILTNHNVKAQSCTQLSSTSSAVLKGQITNTGGDPNMTFWFEWRQAGIFPGPLLSTPMRNVFVSTVPYTFSENLTGLSACTTYEYKAKARNSAGTSEGSIVCFRTSCVLPINVSCSTVPNPANINQMVTFTSNVSGGQPPYTYTWSGACSSSFFGSFFGCLASFNKVGTFTATLVVRDSLGNQNSAQCSVTVRAGLPQVITLPPVETL